jgi:LysR family transcriptional regulator of gallate degradation
VLERARVILADAAALMREASDAVHAIRGPLRIGAMEVLSLDVLPAALTALVAAHPDVVPSCFEQPPEQLLRGVARGELDVGFTVGGAPSEALRRHVLGTSPAVVVCGREHPLAPTGSGRATRADFLSHPWVVPRFFADPPGSRPIDQFPDERLARPVGATIELLRSGVELVAGGRFLGCFPAITIRRELAEGRLVRLRGHPAIPAFELAAYERARGAGSPTVRAVIEAVQRAVRRSPESASPRAGTPRARRAHRPALR